MKLSRQDILNTYSKVYDTKHFDDRIKDTLFGWVVDTQPDAWYENNKDRESLSIGNGPIYIGKETGQVFMLNSLESVSISKKAPQTESDLVSAMQEIGVQSTKTLTHE